MKVGKESIRLLTEGLQKLLESLAIHAGHQTTEVVK